MYAKCLKKLGRIEEFVRITLKMLSRKVATRDNALIAGKETDSLRTGVRTRSLQGHLIDAVTASKPFEQPIVVPMDGYFSKIHIDTCIQHNEGMDGFRLNLTLYYLMRDTVTVQHVEVRLINSTEGSTREIRLAAENLVRIAPGHCQVSIVSKVLICSPPKWALLTCRRL